MRTKFSVAPPVNITGVRIVTKAGNCIDEIVVHGEPVAPPTWGAADFVWTNETGGAWTTGTNWAGSVAPSTGNNKIFFMVAPLAKNRPVLNTGNGLPHVDFGLLNRTQTGGTLDGQHLWWSQTNTNLRTVFLVTSDAVSGSKQSFIGSLEFAATGSYLMRKWFGAGTDQDSSLNRLKGLADTTLDVGAGRILTCKTTEIAGSLEKRGEGRLIIGTGSASSLAVLGGELWLEQPFITAGGGTLSSLTLSNNATLNLRQNALSVQTLTGAGTVSNGTVTATDVMPGTPGGSPQTLTIAGDLVLTAGCEIEADATADACDMIAVSGTLALSANGQVRVTFPQGAVLPASQHLLTFGACSGAPNLASWSVELVPAGTYTATLVLRDHALDIVYHPQGTVLLIN